MTEKEPSAIVIPFGKHKGKTVAELLAADPAYADWITAQAWVAERFAELHAAILTRGAGTDDTPEHNALQASFLDPAFRIAAVRLAMPDAIGKSQKLATEYVVHDTSWDIDLFEKPKYGYETITPERAAIAYERRSAALAGRFDLTTRVNFEIKGIDVLIGLDWNINGEREYKGRDFSIELKPTMGDDYPAVMRQMRRVEATVLVVGAYTGRGASEPQMRAMFAASGITVVFVQEIEEAMRHE